MSRGPREEKPGEMDGGNQDLRMMSSEKNIPG